MKRTDVRCALLTINLVIIASCGGSRVPVEFGFAAYMGDTPARCSDDSVGITDLRFYVSDIALISVDGAEHAVLLADNGDWQNGKVAMIDLEDGKGNCQNGTATMNSTVSGSIAQGQYTGIQFTVGVPFSLNHADPLQAAAPLDDSAMHWHWRSGYKFLRAGIKHSEGSASLHLGSTGCNGTVGDISSCDVPNRLTVRLDDFDPSTDTLVIDLAALFDGASGGCESAPSQTACEEPFTALGLPFGAQPGDGQSVFRVAP